MKFTCATIRSFVFFCDKHMKQVAGKMTQIMTPIVDPTSPKTSSIFGIKTPVISETNTMTNVNPLNFLSGM